MRTTVGELRRAIHEAVNGDDPIMIVANAMDQLRGGTYDQEMPVIEDAISKLEAFGGDEMTVRRIEGALKSLQKQRFELEVDPHGVNIERMQWAEDILPDLAAQLMR